MFPSRPRPYRPLAARSRAHLLYALHLLDVSPVRLLHEGVWRLYDAPNCPSPLLLDRRYPQIAHGFLRLKENRGVRLLELFARVIPAP